MDAGATTSIHDFVRRRNESTILFTPGPASLLVENVTGLRPAFGRGDDDYDAVEREVLDQLRAMTGHRAIARLQGSATLALEIACTNFLVGRVLVVSTGYYSDRLQHLVTLAQRAVGTVAAVDVVDWQSIDDRTGRYDWVVACSTETSAGLRIEIESLRLLATRCGARLLVDATGSIGLERGHDLADVVAYSSCKGLFGLTGAAFVAFDDPPANEPPSFFLDLRTHLDHRVTGPLHAICSLADVLPRHDELREAVVTNKARFTEQFADVLVQPPEHQPLLCTHVSVALRATDPRAVLYTPRSSLGGSVVCHLGEVHLGPDAAGDIVALLTAEPLLDRSP